MASVDTASTHHYRFSSPVHGFSARNPKRPGSEFAAWALYICS